MVRIAFAYAALVASTGMAWADERIHQQPPSPAECKGQLPSGYCVRGETWYKLDGGRVKWILKADTSNAKTFWEEQDRDKFGIGDAGANGGDSGSTGGSTK